MIEFHNTEPSMLVNYNTNYQTLEIKDENADSDMSDEKTSEEMKGEEGFNWIEVQEATSDLLMIEDIEHLEKI